MIKSIINILIEKKWIGTIDDPYVIKSVSEIISKHESLFQTNKDVNIQELSESIISTIINQLTLTYVQTIKILTNE